MLGKIIAIHQLEFLPWLGFFFKIMHSDIFVLYDLAQYNKQDFQNRNYIKLGNNVNSITVPIKHHPTFTLMRDISIVENLNWAYKIKNQLTTWYHSSPHFHCIMKLLEPIWMEKWSRLMDLNNLLIKRICSYLNINTTICLSSVVVKNLHVFSKLNTNDKNLQLCLSLNATTYLTGNGGKNYIEPSRFFEHNINILSYRLYNKENFYPSIIHYLFNYGLETYSFIKSFGELQEYL